MLLRRERRWQATSWDREAREVEDLLAGMMELIANEITPFVKKLYFALTLVKPQKQIFGKSWEFGPTSLTPTPPSPYVGIPKKEKKINVYFAF